MANVGYARVSKDEQNLDMQLFALRAAGCETIYEDVGVSAISERRPGFENAVAALKPGDVFMIWKLDRAFRSLKQSIQTLEHFDKQGLAFRSLTEYIDTSTPMGQAMFQIQNVFSELERKLISERTKAGLEAARRKGKVLGRPRRLSEASIAWALDALSDDANPAICRVAKSLNVSTRTLRRALRNRRQIVSVAPTFLK